MKTKANYFKIGVFVLLVLGMLIAGLIALSARELIRDTIALETYIDESVLGLSVGSPVMQRGVQIGTVRQISFVPQEYGPELGELSDSAFQKYNRYVLVVAEVNRAALPSLPHNNEVANVIRESVANGLRLKISPQGITGIYYLEADYFDPQRYPYIPVPWTPKRYYIPWAPSTLTSFTQSADRILRMIEQVDLKRLSESLDGTLVAIQQIAADAEIAKTRQELADLIAAIRVAVEQADVSNVRADLQRLVGSLEKTNRIVVDVLGESPDPEDRTIRQAVTQLHDTLQRAERLIQGAEGDAEEITLNLKRASQNLRETTERIRANPSRLLFGQEPPPSEVTQ